MHQSTPDQYLDIPSKSTHPPGLSILDFPYHIRKRIYDFAGLFRSCPISLNPSVKLDEADFESPPNIYVCPRVWKDLFKPGVCDCYLGIGRKVSNVERTRLPIQLLYTSRAINEEVCFLLYFTNTFFISRTLPGGLGVLEKLRPSTIAVLHYLTIALNECEHRVLQEHPLSLRGRQFPFSNRSLLGSGMPSDVRSQLMGEWARACERLSCHVNGSLLSLSVI